MRLPATRRTAIAAAVIALLALAPAALADDDVAPTSLVQGTTTGIRNPHGLALDREGRIYTANQYSHVRVFARTASGDVAPAAVISPTGGTLAYTPLGIAISPDQHIWVTYNSGHILEFPAGANGPTTPLREIDVQAHFASRPGWTNCGVSTRGIAFDSLGNIYVSTHDCGFIAVYAPTATGSAAPIRVIAGAATDLTGNMEIAIDADDNLLVTATVSGVSQILKFPFGADGDVAPSGRITSSVTINYANGVDIDHDGNVYVADRAGPGQVQVFPASAYASGSDVDTPSRVIRGSNTLLWASIGIAVQSSTNSIVVANESTPADASGYAGSITVFGALGTEQDRPARTPTSGTATVAPSAPTPPTGRVGISIEDGADFVRTPKVRLRLVWPAGATTALLANDGGFTDAVSVPLAERVDWTLRSTGPVRLPKTVYVRFSGGGVNETQTFSDDVILDETAPKLLSASARQIRDVRARSVFLLRTRAEDGLSGVARLQVQTGARRITTLPYRTHTRFVSSATLVRVRVGDRAGNWSPWRRVRVTDGGVAASATPLLG